MSNVFYDLKNCGLESSRQGKESEFILDDPRVDDDKKASKAELEKIAF